ncbi:hypothetical protein APSETT444_008241 [Aspergillus pseudonomiae]
MVWWHVIVSFSVAGAAYLLWLALQRLWLSPIAHFPGPKLAALTMWYEFYYDSFLEGQYTFRIAEMHRKYGPIVRISPYELHIDDAEYYEALYSRDAPRDKSLHLTGMFGAPASAFGTVDYRRHRIRRQPMNPFFSQQRIRQLEPMLRGMVDKLCHGLRAWKDRQAPLHMYHPFNAFTTDVVVEYTMGDSFHYLDDPDFSPQWSKTMQAIVHAGIQFKQFRWFISLFELLPRWLVMSINPDIGPVIDQKNESMRLANLVIDSQRSDSISTGNRTTVPKGTLFHALLESTLPPEEKTADRLSQEVFTVIAAGGETTARNLATITFYLLNNPEKLEKLREELNRLDPDGTASLVEYEAMPYLTSVMLEGLSLAKAEILLVVARIFREFHLELYKTTVDDVRIVRDMFNGHPRKGSQGVRVVVKEWNGTPGI